MADRCHHQESQNYKKDDSKFVPGQIFVGGLPKNLTEEVFTKHFEKYGNIVDSRIVRDKATGLSRQFGFVTYEDPAAVDDVIYRSHIFRGKKVRVERSIPMGSKLYVGGFSKSVQEDGLKKFFAKFGEVLECKIMRDMMNCSRGFGFISFSTEKSVNDLLANGNRIDFACDRLIIKKHIPRNMYSPPPPTKPYDDRRVAGSGTGESCGRYNAGYSSYGSNYQSGPEPSVVVVGGYGDMPSGGYGYSGGMGTALMGTWSHLGGSSCSGAGPNRAYDEPGKSYEKYSGSSSSGGIRDYGADPSGRYHPYGR